MRNRVDDVDDHERSGSAVILRASLTITILWLIFLGEFSLHVRSQETTTSLFVVAHNAGDAPESRSSEWVQASDIIEIDVLLREGELVAGHPVSFTSAILAIDRTIPVPVPLERAWKAARFAGGIQLDLKSTNDLAIRLLVEFLTDHQDEARVMVTARDPRALRALRIHLPMVCRYLSLPGLSSVNTLFEDSELIGTLDGVAVRQELLDESLMARLHGAGLHVLAWTVNDSARVEELVTWGVDGVATDIPGIAITYGNRGSGADHICSRK